MINQMIMRYNLDKYKTVNIEAMLSPIKYTFMGSEPSITNQKKDPEVIILAPKRY